MAKTADVRADLKAIDAEIIEFEQRRAKLAGKVLADDLDELKSALAALGFDLDPGARLDGKTALIASSVEHGQVYSGDNSVERLLARASSIVANAAGLKPAA